MNQNASLSLLIAGVMALASYGFAQDSAGGGLTSSALRMPQQTNLDTADVLLLGWVEEVDKERRQLGIKGPDGNSLVLQVGQGITEFDTLNKGDRIEVRYLQSVALSIQRPNDPLPAADTIQMTPESGPVTNVSVNAVSKPATVEAIDRRTRMLTFRSSEGVRTSIKVGPELKEFEELKPGDRILTQYTQPIVFDIRKV